MSSIDAVIAAAAVRARPNTHPLMAVAVTCHPGFWVGHCTAGCRDVYSLSVSHSKLFRNTSLRWSCEIDNLIAKRSNSHAVSQQQRFASSCNKRTDTIIASHNLLQLLLGTPAQGRLAASRHHRPGQVYPTHSHSPSSPIPLLPHCHRIIIQHVCGRQLCPGSRGNIVC